MAEFNPVILERALGYNSNTVRRLRTSWKTRWIFAVSPRMKKLLADCEREDDPEKKNAALAAVVNAFEESPVWKTGRWVRCVREDISLFLRHFGKRKITDRSDRDRNDYYSVAVIVKNEARDIKEFILFYMATGADRIYLYDNESDDDLPKVIKPFVDSGFVVYRKWPGRVVQTAAYRDAVRRTRHRTKWLALVDADEFLFSPKGSMPDQLRAYEKYPGIGANWIMFGPNGHVKRPEGLVMDNYTTTIADYNSPLNCHIKSIVQPRRVFCVFHSHFAIYRGKGNTVSESGEVLDNTTTRAFSSRNNREVFIINHYNTKSLEDLERKCLRGYPDGSPNAVPENLLNAFTVPLKEDHTIRRYADLVREMYGDC